MLSGDGMLLRVRPMLGEVSAEAMRGLCDLAGRHGNGLIDLTSRANLQLRGVPEGDVTTLTDGLRALGLLDPDPEIESRRNIVIEAGWRPGDLSHRIATELMGLLGDLPKLPGKFGFAIDTGAEPAVNMVASDVAFELAADGGLILRADGAPGPASAGEALTSTPRWAWLDWFIATGSPELRRMRNLVRHTSLPGHWTGKPPGPLATRSEPGFTPKGPLVGAAFGQILALALDDLIRKSGARALRITPWRQILLEGGHSTPAPGFVTRPDDPLLTADACSGAPICPQAQAETQMIARQMAGRIGGSLHVSGCTKGCARQTAASVTLVGRNGRFDLVKRGRAGDEPAMRGLTPEDLLTLTDLT